MDRGAWLATLHGVTKEKSHGQRSLVGYNPWGHKIVEWDLVTKQQQLHCLINAAQEARGGDVIRPGEESPIRTVSEHLLRCFIMNASMGSPVPILTWRRMTNQGSPTSDRISARDPSYTQAIGFYTTCLKQDTWQISQRSVETATVCSKISVKEKRKPHGVREHTGLMISPLSREKPTPAGGWICQKQRTTWAETADKLVHCRLWNTIYCYV